MTDEELAGFVKNQDHAAYAELIRRYQNKLFPYLIRLLGNKEDALDIVQDTLEHNVLFTTFTIPEQNTVTDFNITWVIHKFSRKDARTQRISYVENFAGNSSFLRETKFHHY